MRAGTMYSSDDPLEIIWAGLLSEDPKQIRIVYASLDQASQISIMLHLQRMVTEPGWLPVQRQSAQCALETLLPNVSEDS